MREARSVITEGGRLVIPSAIRKELNIKVGEEVIMKVESGELHIITYKNAIKQAQALVRRYNKKNVSLTDKLLNERKKDANNEG